MVSKYSGIKASPDPEPAWGWQDGQEVGQNWAGGGVRVDVSGRVSERNRLLRQITPVTPSRPGQSPCPSFHDMVQCPRPLTQGPPHRAPPQSQRTFSHCQRPPPCLCLVIQSLAMCTVIQSLAMHTVSQSLILIHPGDLSPPILLEPIVYMLLYLQIKHCLILVLILFYKLHLLVCNWVGFPDRF